MCPLQHAAAAPDLDPSNHLRLWGEAMPSMTATCRH